MTDQLLSIGQLAADVGLSVSTVRYYDEIGLIKTAARVGGKRRFEQETVGRVNFVQRAKDTGFSLEEIRLILDDTAGGWHDLVDAKLAELTSKRSRLESMISMLSEIRECGCQVVSECERYDCC